MKTVKVEVGQKRGPSDDSRRFTPTALSFDTRAHVLSTVIDDEWDDSIKDQWRANQQGVREVLIHTFGAHNHEEKIKNFTDLGSAPWSVVALHNTYLEEVRAAFTAACYYPALLGACGLGERILNQLVLRLREDYAEHEATKHVATQRSIDKWDKCIYALTGWGVFTDDVAQEYRRLMKQRHAAVHYRSELDNGDARAAALAAVLRISDIVNHVFSPMGDSPHYFTGPIGRSYVKREAESLPFVKHFILSTCVLVSPTYRFVANSSTPGVSTSSTTPPTASAHRRCPMRSSPIRSARPRRSLIRIEPETRHLASAHRRCPMRSSPIRSARPRRSLIRIEPETRHLGLLGCASYANGRVFSSRCLARGRRKLRSLTRFGVGAASYEVRP